MAVKVKDVAAHAGVSVGSVSNVLNRPHIVSRNIRNRVTAAMDELAFVPHDAARQLRVGFSATIGVLVRDLNDPFFAELFRGVDHAAHAFGYSVLLANSRNSLERERAHLHHFGEQRVAGVVFAPIDFDPATLKVLSDRAIRTVLIEAPDSQNAIGSISSDNFAGGALAARHLLAAGRTRLAFLGGPMGSSPVRERLAGARAVVDPAAGCCLEIIEIAELTVAEGRRIGLQLLARSRNQRPDAVFCANDLVAIGVLQAVTAPQAGSIVPGEIAVIGYDDIDLARSSVIPLSSIRQPSYEAGSAAFQLLFGDAAGPPRARRIVLAPTVVSRRSTET